jgi:hypothetical protein
MARSLSTERPPAGFDGRTAAISTAVFLAALGLGLAQLYVAHPAEDAFILFKYADNIARGHGAVYYTGGPRTEGATDFLWLILLSASVAAGADVAVAAVLWNAFGAALAAALLDREVARGSVERRWRLLWSPLPLSLVFVAGAPAAYLGFSSLLYQAMVLATFVVTVETQGRSGLAVPWLGLLLTLFRPDGAFFAAGFVAAAGLYAFRSGGGRTFAASTCAAAAVGVAYFLGRSAYFGLLLPLPLHVKSHGVLHGPVADRILYYLPWLKGIGVQFMWLRSPIGPTAMATASVLITLLPPAPGDATRACLRRSLVAAFASLLFLGALSVAFQVQNVHFRYQAPVTLLVLFVLGGIASRRVAETHSRIRRTALYIAALTALAPGALGGAQGFIHGLRGRSYIDVFPARLASVLKPGRTIALTDAGRLAYWTDTPTIDVAGLNYAPTALHPPSVELLRRLDPDVLLIHPGAAIAGETFPAVSGALGHWQLGPERIAAQISPRYQPLYEHGLDEYGATSNTATVAAVVMLRYLAECGDEYMIEVVRYQGGYRHVFAFRRSLPEAPQIRDALSESTTGRGYASYAALKGFPFAGRFDAEVDGAEQ